MRFEVVGDREVDMHAGLISDQSIRLTGPLVSKDYPERMRMVVYEDFATNNVYRFLTNNFLIDALTVAELYRERWQIELFFYDKFIVMRSHGKCISDYQNVTFLLLVSALHNNMIIW